MPDQLEALRKPPFDTTRASAGSAIGVASLAAAHDRVQDAAGLHSGVALGNLQTVALRPYSRMHIGALGDCINVAARLLSLAVPSELVVSNAF